MIVTKTSIPGLMLVEPKVYGDERGYFTETWNKKIFNDLVTEAEFVQDNQSLSTRGTLRGLHFQSRLPQGKLVRVVEGEVYDVVVDLRNGSNTYGHWEGFHLSGENKKQLWVPPGFAHGFLVLSDTALFSYKCSEFYRPEYEHTLKWDDSELNIQWPLNTPPILSEKDLKGLAFKNLPIVELD